MSLNASLETPAGAERDTGTQMFTAALFTVATQWKLPKCPSADEGVNKVWSAHPVQYYATWKRDEILTRETTWMNLQNFMR